MEEAKMARSRRPGFSDFEKAEIWRGRKSGMTLNSIGRALDRAGPHVRDLVAASGGIAPPPRRRSSWVLGRTEREEISRGIAAGHSMRTIATALERAPSTVSREIARHGGRETYRADAADKAAWTSARRPKRCRLATHGRLRRIVVQKLQRNWAPEQISGWLKERILMPWKCRFHTRRSTAACSFRPEVCSRRSPLRGFRSMPIR